MKYADYIKMKNFSTQQNFNIFRGITAIPQRFRIAKNFQARAKKSAEKLQEQTKLWEATHHDLTQQLRKNPNSPAVKKLYGDMRVADLNLRKADVATDNLYRKAREIGGLPYKIFG